MTFKTKIVFYVSQSYSIRQFFKNKFLGSHYNKQAFIAIRKKMKEIFDSSITFVCRILPENINIFNKKLTNGLFTTENFIFLPTLPFLIVGGGFELIGGRHFISNS